jgi:H+/Cl- antiporter ClcA
MKPETRAKLSAINKDVPTLLKQKAVEKIKRIKDLAAVYLAVVQIVLVIGLAVAFAIYLDPQINLISEQKMPNWEKLVLFIVFAAIAILLFLYNKKFFMQASKDTNWVWRWKKKKTE